MRLESNSATRSVRPRRAPQSSWRLRWSLARLARSSLTHTRSVAPVQGNSTVADLWSLGICLYEFVEGQARLSFGQADLIQELAARSSASFRLPVTAPIVASSSLICPLQGFDA